MNTSQPTYDDILRLFQETDRKFQELIKELFISQKETDRKFQETDRKFQDTDRKFQETSRETNREIRAVNESIGRLGNRLGQFVEEAVRPAAVKLFRERGIDVHEVHQNITAKREGETLEVDLLVVNNNDVVAIECKSNLSIDDVNDHLKRLEKIKRLLPDHKEKRISGAVAGMVIPENVAIYAIKKGLYVIGQNGDHLELRNEVEFVAKVW